MCLSTVKVESISVRTAGSDSHSLTKPTSVAYKMEDVLSCPVCLETFDLHLHVPLVLCCGHTLCHSCITSIYATSSQLQCPHDRHIDPRPINALTRNYLVCDAIDRYNRVQKETSRCEKHHKKLKLYCRQPCGQLLCTRCILEGHREHQVVDTEDDAFTLSVIETVQPYVERSKADSDRMAQELQRLETLVSTCDRRKVYAQEQTQSEYSELASLLTSKSAQYCHRLEVQAAAYKSPIMASGHLLKQRYDQLIDHHNRLLTLCTALVKSPVSARLSLLVQLDSLIQTLPESRLDGEKFDEPPMFIGEDLRNIREMMGEERHKRRRYNI